MEKVIKKAVKNRTTTISKRRILEINEGYRIAYRSDSDEIARMACVYFHHKK